MNTDIIVVLISSIASMLISIGSAAYAYYVTDRQKQKNDRDLAELNSRLENRNAEQHARRDYEYEARKKLYEEYEPLFFRFSEASEAGFSRVRSLANRAADGNLGEEGWLQNDPYYLQSTCYYLIAPLATYRLLRSKLTFVDLLVVKNIYSTYVIGKVLFASFSDAFLIAKKMGLSYSPYDEPKDPRQDLPIGVTENIAEFLIEPDPEIPTRRRIMTLGRFQEVFKHSQDHDIMDIVTMMQSFHPSRRPVLWRVLIVQAILYKVIIGLRHNPKLSTKEKILTAIVKAAEAFSTADFDWRTSDEKTETDAAEFNGIIRSAQEYLKESIERYY